MHQALFADANSDYEKARYVICGVPFDGTSSYRLGSRFAPDEMRAASYNFETYSSFFDHDLADVDIHDAGNLEVAENIDDTLFAISKYADKYVNDGKIPVMLGGEHSLSYPFVKACKNKYPELGFVVLDAHMDLREEFHGEKNSHACISRHVIDDLTQKYVSIGIRSGTREEYEYVSENKIKMFTAEDVYSIGIEKIISEFRDYIKGPVYLSVDMDAIDPAYAPALGTPEPFGITPRDVRDVISCLAPQIVGFDLVEIAPAYDSGGTAVLGAKLVRDFIAASAKARLFLEHTL
ncbi:MAG: agmatinase [Candidatus Methanoperedens nitroreducens]|uniref:Agmatinase n=1 Tax=Candidatus Methanoperedens nitratireducens TaxID=1392998 RepID=A0A0P7ZGU5_9EURY|nr:agmatinase [Candidatus Methanoperedens sp. BLZ2]KAB2945100.1 MAG: agmatinase [Candidatus Methanoperedens sp.]KPQ44108.1 MAG: agmatinase [Candidatus Methanoperedens sp. BLZ1]MBZ0177001.1 agmatinase [Candidatus Methanoperedens nitroreducens]MCX9078181.1 agmatinase [Candidatus Methanoperedens sp.]